MPSSDETPEPGHTLRLDADTLAYTREGLKTREDLVLRVGQHNRVVIVRPTRARAVSGAHGGFAVGESFPLCAALRPLWIFAPETSVFAHARGEEEPRSGVFQVYGHADESGDEHGNKTLSDRRAEIARALLIADVDAVEAIAADEAWGDAHRQVMLRVLGCDPGPIDGDLGPLSVAAVELFQRRYREGDFHRHNDAPPPRNDDLVVDGDLGTNTRAALVESFVVANAPHVGADALHPSHPSNGCAMYNGTSTDSASDRRRFTLVVHPAVPPHSENAPCTAGDEQACAVVDDEPQRCLWFREHVDEPPPDVPCFYDPRWLDLGNGRYLLSAVTTVPEAEEVQFQVYEAPRGWRKEAEGALADLTVPVGEPLAARSTLGVVHAVWEAPPEWLSQEAGLNAEGLPVFEVQHEGSGARGHAPWPETDIVRILFAALDADGPFPSDRPESYRLRATNGQYDQSLPIVNVVRSSLHHFMLEFRDAPIDARFDLSCDFHGEGVFDAAILEDAPFEDLDSGCSEGTRCFEEPPPLAADAAAEDPHDHPDAYVPIDDDDTEPALGAQA